MSPGVFALVFLGAACLLLGVMRAVVWLRDKGALHRAWRRLAAWWVGIHWWWPIIGRVERWLRVCPLCDGWGEMPIEPMPGHEQLCARCRGTGRRFGRRKP